MLDLIVVTFVVVVSSGSSVVCFCVVGFEVGGSSGESSVSVGVSVTTGFSGSITGFLELSTSSLLSSAISVFLVVSGFSVIGESVGFGSSVVVTFRGSKDLHYSESQILKSL